MAVTSPRNRKYPRANFLDYSEGSFFVTICIKNKKHLLGEIKDGVMHYSSIGKYADKCISEIPGHNPDAEILIHTVMPNHIHAIVRLVGLRNAVTASNMGRLNRIARIAEATNMNVNEITHFNSRLAVVIGGMKAVVTRFANKQGIKFAWQSRFHEHYIRNPHEGDKIWNYIETNIENWDKDCFYR
ncbi:MAG: transposase [Muribaculaceae bacterium]|nr:transposase [Muribaculaceae bacterium]